MSELFDTHDVKDDAEHWDALAVRVAREAARRSGHGDVGLPLASRAGLLVASLLLAASIAFMTTTWRHAAPRSAADLGQALAPSDDVGRAITAMDRPPAVAVLLFDEPRQGGGEP